jgi:hypothetical protein
MLQQSAIRNTYHTNDLRTYHEDMRDGLSLTAKIAAFAK